MTRRQGLWIVFAALALAGCSIPLHAMATGTAGWEQTAAVLGVLVAAVGVRVAWLLAMAARAIRTMPAIDASAELQAAARSAGIRRLLVIDSDVALAICYGPIRPRVVVSSGLAGSVGGRVLDAVLLHEAYHASHHEPLRRAVFDALADVLLAFPALRWWADRKVEDSELAADRAAIARVGAESVAAALVVVGASTPPAAVAAFGGCADLRAAQVLGDALPARRMPTRTVLGSLAGLVLLASASLCTTPAVG
ncbi:MAG: hypothetical protein NVSMB17_00040 [Candidatus Dormibacteria bacterium]